MAQQRAQPTSTMKKKNPLDGGAGKKEKNKEEGNRRRTNER